MKALIVLNVVLLFLAGCLTGPERRITELKNEVVAIVTKETDRAKFEARLRNLGAKIGPWLETNQFIARITLNDTPGGSRTLMITYFVDDKGRVTQVRCDEVELVVTAPAGIELKPA